MRIKGIAPNPGSLSQSEAHAGTNNQNTFRFRVAGFRLDAFLAAQL